MLVAVVVAQSGSLFSSQAKVKTDININSYFCSALSADLVALSFISLSDLFTTPP